jgi:uncharacterized cupredoxin-like copper-binding protein
MGKENGHEMDDEWGSARRTGASDGGVTSRNLFRHALIDAYVHGTDQEGLTMTQPPLNVPDIARDHRERTNSNANARYLVAIGLLALAVGVVALGISGRRGIGVIDAQAATFPQDANRAAMAMGPDGDHEDMAVDPAKLAAPDQTILIEATDQMDFTPGEISVAAGDSVAFVVTNTGVALHELVIGDAEVQQAHEAEMSEKAGEDADHADDHAHGQEAAALPFAIDVPPGETTTLVYIFDEPGTLLYGCHEPGHYPAGMKGTVTVTRS